MQFTELPHTVNTAAPLIYMWEIHSISGDLVGRYVGKAKGGARRPRTHYGRNVRNILAGKPYRKGKPLQFRRVHVALADAVRAGHRVTLRLLCNVADCEDIDAVEQAHICAMQCRGSEPWQLNG